MHKKIAILTSGIRPVPAVQGGAVENLVEAYLDYNERQKLYDITVYSVWHNGLLQIPQQKGTTLTHYHYIDVNSRWNRLRKAIYLRLHGREYYHDTVEFFFEEAYRHLKRQNYDVIVVENRPGYVLKLRQRTSVPIVVHLHNDFLNIQTRAGSDIYESSTRIICVSDYIVARVKTLKNNINKCLTVYNAIDINRFYHAQPESRSSYGFKEGDIVLAYSGRLTEEKGILELIKAVRLVNLQKDVKLLVIGANDYGDHARENTFTQQLKIEAEELKGKIVFTGYVDYRQIPSLLKMANIAVIPSMWEEPFGLTVVEAMAAGLPLITTRSGGIPEICEGVARIVDKKNVVENMAEAILEIAENTKLRHDMAKKSITRSNDFNKSTYARQFLDALDFAPKR